MPVYQGRLTTRFPEDVFPAPYVSVRVDWRGVSRDLLGLIDSGADQSTIPILTAGAMQLQKIEEVDVLDANGGSESRDVFTVNVEFHGFTVQALPVAATDFPVMLIGRDVLSDLVTELNGPAQTFSLKA